MNRVDYTFLVRNCRVSGAARSFPCIRQALTLNDHQTAHSVYSSLISFELREAHAQEVLLRASKRADSSFYTKDRNGELCLVLHVKKDGFIRADSPQWSLVF